MSKDLQGRATDIIFLHDYVIKMMIGINDIEYLQTQRVRCNVEAQVTLIDHMPRDVRDIFSYDFIVDGITKIAASGHVLFVEELAERIAAHVLGHARVKQVMVRIEKLDIYPGSVGVELIRISR